MPWPGLVIGHGTRKAGAKKQCKTIRIRKDGWNNERQEKEPEEPHPHVHAAVRAHALQVRRRGVRGSRGHAGAGARRGNRARPGRWRQRPACRQARPCDDGIRESALAGECRQAPRGQAPVHRGVVRKERGAEWLLVPLPPHEGRNRQVPVSAH